MLLYLVSPKHDAFCSYNGIDKLLPIMLKIILFPRWCRAKELACNAGDMGSIPGLERSPGEEMATHFSILAWEIPWTEEPGGLQRESDTHKHTKL